MLTLDSLQLERQRRQTRSLELRERERLNVQKEIRNKEITVAPDGEIDRTSLAQQLGQPLSSQEFIKRLEWMNRSLIFEVANADPTKMGIYIVENRPQLDGSVKAEKRFICGMERGFMPERSVLHSRKDRVPDPEIRGAWREVDVFTKETRGWRTVLQRLLTERLITAPQIERMFPLNMNSRNWQRLTS